VSNRPTIIKKLLIVAAWITLTACQPLVAAGPEEPSLPFHRPASPSATYTPFQAVLPTETLIATSTATAVPTTTQTPTMTPAPCMESAGHIVLQEVVFAEGRPPFAFRVYLPPCMGVEDDVRYPVLYMIHGQSFNDDQWERLGIGEAADALIVEGKAPPFIIVMPRENNTYQDIYASSFPVDVVDYLIPWVDRTYPTCTARDCRAIGGLSRGGAWALHLGFTRWELFGSVGLHSTPPFIGDPGRFPGWLREIPPDQLPRLYLDTGHRDWWIRPTTEFEALLVQMNVPHEWNLFEGTHDEVYWSANVRDYLEWYTLPWHVPSP
jgi:enterochelin esterase-like enzyme